MGVGEKWLLVIIYSQTIGKNTFSWKSEWVVRVNKYSNSNIIPELFPFGYWVQILLRPLL